MNGIDIELNGKISPNLEIRFVPEKGRCIYSKVVFKKGEAVFEEDPLVCCQFAWNAEYRYHACDHCMRPLETVAENINRLAQIQFLGSELMFPELDPTDKTTHVNCNSCNVTYCSPECKEKSFIQYHNNLCHMKIPGEPLFELNNKWKELHMPPETTSIMLFARVIGTIEQSVVPENTYNMFMRFCHLTTDDSETLIHNLLSNKFADDLEELYKSFIHAMRSRKIVVQQNVYVDSLLTRDGFIRMFAMLGRNGQGVGTTALGKWVSNTSELVGLSNDIKEALDKQISDIYTKVEEVSGDFLDCEGSALYLLHSSINHSCKPNVEATFPHNNNKIVLKALEDILPDEEICISYIDECNRMMKYKKRQQFLRENYLFNCTCTRCEEEALLGHDNEDSSDEESSEYDDCDSDCEPEHMDMDV